MLIDVDNSCKLSGGLIIQLLPNASEKTICYLEDVIKKYPSFNDLLENNNLEQILTLLFKLTFEFIPTELFIG